LQPYLMTITETHHAPSWDVDDLVRRLTATLDTASLALTTVSGRNEPENRPDAAALRLVADKVIAETAMLLLAASSIGDAHPGIRDRVADLVDRIEPFARSDAVLAAICIDAASARDHAFSHAILSRLGRPNRDVDALLSMSIALGQDVGPERLPFRELEQEWLQRGWDPDDECAPADLNLQARSRLGRPLDTLQSTRDDLYALTHAVMYATDMGMRPGPFARPAEDIAADAEAGLAFSLDRDDFDLTAELLLAWPMLRVPWSPTATFAFRVLVDLEDELGFVPGCSFDLARYQGLSGVEQADYRLLTTYHTAYVMGFLYAAALLPGFAPPACVAASTSGPQHEAAPRWRKTFAALEPKQVEGLYGFLLASSLRRAVAAGDVAEVRGLLQTALADGRADGPVVAQAAALLRRVALLSSLQASRQRRAM